ncbi:hypothetical protein Pfo_016929 [Paulownia fortunei]|nr:hypothetical protein Pfo_016929 [Paulownia fortunei]
MTLVPKVLDGTNYTMCRRSTLISLSAKNKLGFIKGTITTPEESDHKYVQWQRCNDMVLSWILNSLHQELANSVLYVETPPEIWLDLQERFSQGNFSHHYQIQRSIVELKQNQDSIFTYYTKIKTLWDELKMCSPIVPCTCGGLKQLTDKEEKTYAVIRGQIMLMHLLPTVKKVYSLLCEEDKQRELAKLKVTEQVHAMNVKSSPNFRQSDSKPQGSKKRLHCTYCDGTTHTVERCFYLNGFPVGYKLHGKDVKPPNQAQKISANQTGAESSHSAFKTAHIPDQALQFTPEEFSQIKAFLRNEKSTISANYTGISTPFYSSSTYQNLKSSNWIVDSGATNHIATSITDKPNVPMFSQVTLPNGSYAKITSVGYVHISQNLHIYNVLCSPSFHVNLLSVCQLTSALNCSIHFFPTFCILQDLATKRMIGLGKQRVNSHLLSIHKRMGHPSKLPSQFLLKIIPPFFYDSHHSCDVCPLAKQTRLSFSPSSIQSTHSFDLIHCDIWGPQKIETHCGAHYF